MAGKKTVLVTGGSGLIGSGIKLSMKRKPSLKRDNEKWIFVSSKDANLLDLYATKVMFERYNPTHVIHLAGKAAGLFGQMKKKLDFLEQNMIINENVLHTCKEFGVKKVVSCLSACAYPDKTTYPIDETMMHNGPPHHSNFGYAYAKRMLDIYNRAYHEQYGCHFTSVIPVNVYGPCDNFNLEESHVVPGLVHKVYKAKKTSTDFTVFGTGSALRQFIYSLDIGELLIWALRDYPEIDPINLSVGEDEEVPIKDVVGLVADAIDFSGTIRYDTTKADGQYKKTVNNAKLMTYRPDFNFTPIRKGIKETVDWFVKNIDTART